MNYLRRDLVNERLRLSRPASYRMIGSSRLSLISSDDVLEFLNGSRRGQQPVLTEIPSDICTAEELIEGDVTLKDSGITPHLILAWTNRRKNPPPHFRYDSHTRRFRRSSFRAWLAESTRLRKST